MMKVILVSLFTMEAQIKKLHLLPHHILGWKHLFYMNIQEGGWAGAINKDYKDKGFNLKLRIKEEGVLPAIAVGINDLAGTGYYGSEYVVGSYGINNVDMHFGLAWGNLNGSKRSFKNPLSILSSSFSERPSEDTGYGGQFQTSRYFSDEDVSPFFWDILCP